MGSRSIKRFGFAKLSARFGNYGTVVVDVGFPRLTDLCIFRPRPSLANKRQVPPQVCLGACHVPHLNHEARHSSITVEGMTLGFRGRVPYLGFENCQCARSEEHTSELQS